MTRKWKRRLAWSTAALGLLALLAVGAVYAEWKWTRSQGEARRAAVLAKLDAEEPGWRAADLCAARNARLPPEERNAAYRALRAAEKTPKAFMEWEHRQAEVNWERPPVGVLIHPDDLCEMCAVREECAEVLAVARSVRALPAGGFPFTYAEPNPMGTLLPFTQQMRGTAALLELDAIVLAQTGRANDAVESAHAILATARALGDEPTLISQLVRIAITAIAVRSLERTLGVSEPARGLAEIQAAFTDELTMPRMAFGLRGERAMSHLIYEGLDDGRMTLGTLADGVKSTFRDRMTTRYYRKYLPLQEAVATELLTECLQADRLSGPARRAAFEAVEGKVPRTGYDMILVRLLLPSVIKVAEAEDRDRAQLGCAIAALACERYRSARGHYPESLDHIPKDILTTVPEDPYTGKPLLYRRTDDGAVVYSTGRDGIDDGGEVLDAKNEPGTDFGVRLFTPGHRARPPLPKPEPDDVPDGPGAP